MRLLLIRHGETAWNAAGRFQGHTDMPLNARGLQQAAALARVTAGETFRACYSSDLQRALETARRITAASGVPVLPEPHWREMAFGAWEGLTFATVQSRDAAALAAWQAEPLHTAPPGGETLSQVAQRVNAALRCLLRRHLQQTVVLVAHGGPLRVLLCLALGLPVRAHWYFTLHPGSLSEVRFETPGVRLTRLNHTYCCTREQS